MYNMFNIIVIMIMKNADTIYSAALACDLLISAVFLIEFFSVDHHSHSSALAQIRAETQTDTKTRFNRGGLKKWNKNTTFLSIYLRRLAYATVYSALRITI